MNPRTLDVYPVRADTGQFIVELQPAALADEESAAMTISHELYHLRAWQNGFNVSDELGPETAAELTQMYWRG